MPEAYEPTLEEKKLLAAFALNKDVSSWDNGSKIQFIALVNKKAGLPFGTIGLLRTVSKKCINGVWEEIPKEVPYADRQTTVELGAQRKVSVQLIERDIIPASHALFVARATDVDSGRYVDATGVCALTDNKGALTGDKFANKIMHAETKAKRRATLELCGLGFLDESETESMEGVSKVELEAPQAVSGDATTSPKTEPQQPKGNGKASISPANTTVTIPANVPQNPVVTAAESSNETAGKPADDPKQSGAGNVVAPTNTAATSAAASPESPKTATVSSSANPATVVAPATPQSNIPARFAAQAHLFTPDSNGMCASAEHIKFIVEVGSKQCGWDTKTQLSPWLLQSYNVSNSNKAETLTSEVFFKIMKAMDDVLTQAGR